MKSYHVVIFIGLFAILFVAFMDSPILEKVTAKEKHDVTCKGFRSKNLRFERCQMPDGLTCWVFKGGTGGGMSCGRDG